MLYLSKKKEGEGCYTYKKKEGEGCYVQVEHREGV